MYFKTAEEGIDLALDTQIIVQSILFKIAKLQRILFKDETTEQYCNISFHKYSISKGNKALKALDKKHYIFVIYIFSNKNYLAFSLYHIKMRVKIAKVDLIPCFG